MKKGCVCLCCACMLAMAVPGHSAIAQSQQIQEQAEVESLLREYYKACSDGNLERARSLIAMRDSYEEKVLGEWAKECGVKAYDIAAVDAYHLERDDCWLVYVEYDMSLEDMDVTIPGAVTYVLCKGESGWEDCSDSESETRADDIAQITGTEMYIDKISDVNRRYQEVFDEHPELWEWARALADRVNRGKMGETKPEETEPEETEALPCYIVQGGDSLWSIAREKFGSGLYWTKLYEQNRDVIGENPNLILIGTELCISYE